MFSPHKFVLHALLEKLVWLALILSEGNYTYMCKKKRKLNIKKNVFSAECPFLIAKMLCLYFSCFALENHIMYLLPCHNLEWFLKYFLLKKPKLELAVCGHGLVNCYLIFLLKYFMWYHRMYFKYFSDMLDSLTMKTQTSR